MRSLVASALMALPLLSAAQSSAVPAPPPTQAAPQALPPPAPQPPHLQPPAAPPMQVQTAPAPQAPQQVVSPPQDAPPPQGSPQYASPPPQPHAPPPPQAYWLYCYPPPQQQGAPLPQAYPLYCYPVPPAYPPPQASPQVAPPPSAPPAQLASPAAPPARREHERGSWYIGFHLGGGDGNVRTDRGTFSLERYMGKSQTTLALGFQVGATLSPKVLLGLDISGISSGTDGSGSSVNVMVHNYDLMLTFFPMNEGLFLRGGGGLSKFTLDVKDVNGVTGSDSVNGTNLSGAIGYAWWLGKHFNLTANLEYSNQWYRGNEIHQPQRADYWALSVGCDWY